MTEGAVWETTATLSAGKADGVLGVAVISPNLMQLKKATQATAQRRVCK